MRVSVVTSGFVAAGALLLVGLAISSFALAQAARSGSGNAQAQAQLQQLATERTQLQAENARLRSELEALKKRQSEGASAREAAERRARAAQASIESSVAARAAAERDLVTQRDRMQELVDKFRETVQQLRTVETERAALVETSDAQKRDLAACAERNATLYTMNDELLTRLERRGAFGPGLAAEPFTRLKRTELENYAADVRYRAEEQRIQPTPMPAPIVAPPSN